MNLVLANDNMISNELENLAPHKNSLSINKVKTLTNASSIPKPVASTISNWLESKREYQTDPAKVQFLASLAEAA